MLNKKIDELIGELDEAIKMLMLAITRDKISYKSIYEIKLKLKDVSSGLRNLLKDIESEKAIENCKVKQLAINDEIGDCGTENGKCIGYANSGGEPYEECRNCGYGGFEEEE